MVLDMTTVTMRELMHNPTGVLRIVEYGGTVRLNRRERPLARLIPEPAPTRRQLVMVDFMSFDTNQRRIAVADGLKVKP